MNVLKSRCDGEWSESRFNSFIKSALRRTSMRWKPKSTCKKNARHSVKLLNEKGRLVFHSLCANCECLTPESTSAVDHIIPVVPITGFTSWDEVIDRMFCEVDGLQVLCNACHKSKTKEESSNRKLYNASRQQSTSI